MTAAGAALKRLFPGTAARGASALDERRPGGRAARTRRRMLVLALRPARGAAPAAGAVALNRRPRGRGRRRADGLHDRAFLPALGDLGRRWTEL
jgi:hypothetical protein